MNKLNVENLLSAAELLDNDYKVRTGTTRTNSYSASVKRVIAGVQAHNVNRNERVTNVAPFASLRVAKFGA